MFAAISLRVSPFQETLKVPVTAGLDWVDREIAGAF